VRNPTQQKLKLFPSVIDTYPTNGKFGNTISRIDISGSAIGFDLNTRLLRPRLVKSTFSAHMRRQ